MEHLYVKFGDPSCVVFYRADKQTEDKRKWKLCPLDFRLRGLKRDQIRPEA